MGGVCTKGSARQQALETPVQRNKEESQWVSSGKLIQGETHAQEVAEAAQEWLAVNPGWKYANEFRDETNGEGDAAQTYTYFKVTKVPSLPTSQMPVATTQDKKPAMKS